MNWQLVSQYVERVLPGVALMCGFLACAPRRLVELRLCIYIGLFILLRDVMTPLHFWSFGTSGTFWLRFFNEPILLLVMSFFTGLLILGLKVLEPALWKGVIWKKGSHCGSGVLGVAGAALIVAPSWFLSWGVPVEVRGGAVPLSMMGSLFVFSMVGNCYEEILFRGFLQGYLEERLSPSRAALLSGLAFAVGHVFLASTITQAGPVLLGFTLYEGWIAAFLRMKSGLGAAVVAHGGAIFLLASGLV